ncbi:MspA family porin [Gordonia rhizosphera]|uniref:MspA family protein n=1 Tax=Gordonia rhizosphera NBRC 16068 TaxID=1108045 RepID=K6V8H6_9ACTN|nr:MspA family porin [Gordonia rhizosphera]GAB92533.1 hypothetical protein GORHZ_182_00360 [Gordonia rhizosphera NBRC 16068]
MKSKSVISTGVVWGVCVAAGVGVLSGIGPAAAGPLPGGAAHADLGGGTTMTARLVNEKVDVQPGNVAGIPTSRVAWVSGAVRVSVTGKAKGGVIKGGYVVGCQVNLAGAGTSGAAGVNTSTGALIGPTAGGTLTLGPGQAAYVPIIDQKNYALDADNALYTINGYQFAGKQASVAYSQEELRVNGCAGYAQARARITIQVTTPSSKSETTLWGRPFSLG